MPVLRHAVALTLAISTLTPPPLPGQARGAAPTLARPLPADLVPFDDDMVCNSPFLNAMQPTALKVMEGEYEFESLALAEGEEADGDLWAQFNYPKKLTIPKIVGIQGASLDDFTGLAWQWKLTIDKEKLTMKNFLLFSVDVPDRPYELASDYSCVGWKNNGFYFRGTTSWDGTMDTKNTLIIPLPGPPSSLNPLTAIILTTVCYSLTGDCWKTSTPGMRPSLILGRGMPVGYWKATNPGEASAAADRIYNRSRWAPLPGGNGDAVPTDGDGKDAFPFTTYDIEAVGGIDAEIETRTVEVCQNGSCVRRPASVFVLRRIVDGAIRRRFYNDPRLGFPNHYPGGQEFQAFFTAGDDSEMVSGAADPTCVDLSERCFLLADNNIRFLTGLIAMKELCGSFNPCGARWGRPKEPINAEVVIEGTDDSLRFATWCTSHQGAACNDSTSNPLDGRDVLVKKDSLDRMENEARDVRAKRGYIDSDTAGTRKTLSGDRGPNAPRGPSEAERLCRVRTTRDSLVYVNGPILETEDRRLRKFNADSAFASCQASLAPGGRGGAGGAPGSPQ